MEETHGVGDRIPSDRNTTIGTFRDYNEHLKPVLDAEFDNHLAHLLGSARLRRSQRENSILGGGKRVRGSLLCLVTSALNGAEPEAIPRAVAVELIQTATLIHDDVVDQHETRRNHPALWTVEGARKAVLLGDVIFASAIRMMSELGRRDGLIVSRAIADISQGAYQEPMNLSSFLEDVGKAAGEATALYEKIIYLKTGVLFGAACQLGAVAAKVDDTRIHEWHRYGLRIGEAYQIADDLHEIERALVSGSITRSEMASLAPALLFFVRESRPYINDISRGKSVNTQGGPQKHFEAAAGMMKAEIERRLGFALSSIESGFPDGMHGLIARRAPWDIIAMFNETRTPVSSP